MDLDRDLERQSFHNSEWMLMLDALFHVNEQQIELVARVIREFMGINYVLMN
jgi:hypothetical protein